MTADDERNRVANVEGTRHAVELANALGAGAFTTPPRSPSPALYKGLFREDMFDEGQKLEHPYHRTKFESEKIVRTQTHGARGASTARRSSSATRRPARWTRSTGPYYFFTAIKMARHYLPGWFPLIGPELGYTNLVPVDFVADAMDHIAHQPGLDGQAFHLTNPQAQRSGDVINAFAAAAHAPQLSMRIDTRLLQALPKGTLGMLMQLPGRQGRAPGDPRRLRDPRGGPRLHRPRPPSSTPATPSGRSRAPGSRCRRSSPTRPSCGTTGSATSIPTCSRTAASRAPSTARPCSSPAPRAGSARPRRSRSPRAGGIPLLVARSADKLEETTPGDRGRRRHRLHLLGRHLRPRLGRRARASRCWPTIRPSTCWSTTPAARSAARSRSPTTASTTSSARSSSTTWARSS